MTTVHHYRVVRGRLVEEVEPPLEYDAYDFLDHDASPLSDREEMRSKAIAPSIKIANGLVSSEEVKEERRPVYPPKWIQGQIDMSDPEERARWKWAGFRQRYPYLRNEPMSTEMTGCIVRGLVPWLYGAIVYNISTGDDGKVTGLVWMDKGFCIVVRQVEGRNWTYRGRLG